MSLDAMLRTTVTLQRQVVTSDTFAGQVKTWAAVASATSVSADIQPASSSTEFRYRQRSLICTHSIFFAEDIGARDTDRLIEDSTGRVFKVHGYRPPGSGYDQWPATADVEEVLVS